MSKIGKIEETKKEESEDIPKVYKNWAWKNVIGHA
jgi:hypothetical protein